MRKIYILLFTLAAACCFIGCTREDAVENTGNGDVIIRLEVDGLETKSAANADENYVENLQVLVFKDVNAAPAKRLTPSITAGAGPFEQSYATLSDFGGFTATELKDAVVFAVANYSGDLSGVGSLAAAKALVVNADGFLTTSPDGPIVKSEPRFIMIAEGAFAVQNISGTNKAVAELTLTRLAVKITLNLTYAKTNPSDPITTEDTAAGTTTVWTPMAEGNVRVYLSNGANNGKLGGDPADSPDLFTYADDHPDGEGTLTSSAFYTYPVIWNEGSDNAPYIKIIQPWSYKTIIDEGTPGNPKPVIIDQNVVELYYKVVFPGLTALAGNTWYQPTVTLNVLGGESTRNMRELTTSGFDILPWGTVGSGAGEGLSPIKIDPAKFLAVERDTTFVNNGDAVAVNYVASGPTTLTVERIYKTVFTDTARDVVREIYPSRHSSINDIYSADWFTNSFGTVKANDGKIQLNHHTSGVFNDTNFSSRPYVYQLRLHLDGESTDDLDKVFYIVQNPRLLVDVAKSSTGWICVNGQDANHGYTAITTSGVPVTANYYVNGYQPRTSSQGEIEVSSGVKKPYSVLENGTASSSTNGRYIHMKWYKDTVPGYRQSDNNLGQVGTYDYLGVNANNMCEWIVAIRPSSVSGKYIMDPRIDLTPSANASNNLNLLINKYSTRYNQTTINDGTPLSSNSTDIANVQKYRPTNTTGVENVVAPEYLVASSFGKTTKVNYMVAVLRCAAYQEDGYPAGRWRLPTESELEYAVELAKKGAIPNLFNGNYWASSTRYYDGSSWHDASDLDMTGRVGNAEVATSARCVYDSWYWGKEEVNALKLGVGTTFGNDFSVPQYQWSGYGYTSKN